MAAQPARRSPTLTVAAPCTPPPQVAAQEPVVGQNARATQDRSGVVVLGMHRSGTSAVTRALNLLGLTVCPPSDVIGADPNNPTGHWESRTLVECNNAILLAAGARSICPPPPGPAWISRPAVQDLIPLCRAAFRAVHPSPPWVWKDPRTCLTADLWLPLLQAPPAIVLVARDPLQIARSVNARDSLSLPLCLALWERYLREAMRSAVGLPVWVTWFDQLLDDAQGWIVAALRFLGATGIRPAGGGVDPFAAAGDIDSRLRHHGRDDTEDHLLSTSQHRLRDLLHELTGAHPSFALPELPEETASNEQHFAAVRPPQP
jgi:O-antigen biosynthesis protein